MPSETDMLIDVGVVTCILFVLAASSKTQRFLIGSLGWIVFYFKMKYY